MKVYLQKIFLVSIVLLVCFPLLSFSRHRCPKTPSPPGLLGITTLPTLLPSGTFMAAARSSNTSGCNNTHPSNDFYRPKKKIIQKFIEDNFEFMYEETAKGNGPHLDALSFLSGCKNYSKVFFKVLKQNYSDLFLHDQKSLTVSSRIITDKIYLLKTSSQELEFKCFSG